MTAVLLTLADFKAHVGYQKSDLDTVLQGYLDAAEALLSEKTGHTFAAETSTVTDEVYSGEGDQDLYLRRPVSSVSSIKVSSKSDPASVDSTIPTTDVRVDPVNDHRIVRFQNGVFPLGQYNIFVSYSAKANAPEIAKQAVREAGELMYRMRGRAHLQSQGLGDLGSETLMAVEQRLWQLPTWGDAVRLLRERLSPGMVLA